MLFTMEVVVTEVLVLLNQSLLHIVCALEFGVFAVDTRESYCQTSFEQGTFGKVNLCI